MPLNCNLIIERYENNSDVKEGPVGPSPYSSSTSHAYAFTSTFQHSIAQATCSGVAVPAFKAWTASHSGPDFGELEPVSHQPIASDNGHCDPSSWKPCWPLPGSSWQSASGLKVTGVTSGSAESSVDTASGTSFCAAINPTWPVAPADPQAARPAITKASAVSFFVCICSSSLLCTT